MCPVIFFVLTKCHTKLLKNFLAQNMGIYKYEIYILYF